MFERFLRARAALPATTGNFSAANTVIVKGDQDRQRASYLEKCRTLFDRLPVDGIANNPGLFARVPVSENFLRSDRVGEMYMVMKQAITEQVSETSGKNILRGFDPFTGTTKSINIPALLRFEIQTEEKAKAVFDALSPIVCLSLDLDRMVKSLRSTFNGNPEKFGGWYSVWRKPANQKDGNSPTVYQIDALKRDQTRLDFLPGKTIKSRINDALKESLFSGFPGFTQGECERFYLAEKDVPRFLQSPHIEKVKKILAECNPRP